MEENFNTIKTVLENALIEDGFDPQRFNISYEKIQGIPYEIVCFKKRLGWYYYMSDEKNWGCYRGPYNFNVFVQILSYKLPLSDESIRKIEQKFYSKKMEDFFCDNYYLTREEIDEYEKKLLEGAKKNEN